MLMSINTDSAALLSQTESPIALDQSKQVATLFEPEDRGLNIALLR